MRSHIAQWQLAPAQASLFGSAARGDGDEESDIDLLIVRSDGVDADDERWQAQLEQLRDGVARWTGNRAAISELSEAEVRVMLTDEPPILAELRRDAIALAGSRFNGRLSRCRE